MRPAVSLLLILAAMYSKTQAQDLNTDCDLSADAMTNIYGLNAPQTCIDVNGVTRCWYTYTPSITISGAIPLVIDFHGATTCASGTPWYTGWAQLASGATGIGTDEHFILAMPQGNTDPSISDDTCWNAGYCCCFIDDIPTTATVEDSLFVTKVIDALFANSTLQIDTNRVYLAGHSNGCMLAQRFIAERSDLIAAVGCHAGVATLGEMSFGGNWLKPIEVNATGYVPTPIMTVHGTADKIVPYDGALYIPGAEESISWWAEANACDMAASITVDSSGKYATHEYSGCAGNTTAKLLEMYGVGHAPYVNFDTDVDTTRIVKEFMFQFHRQVQSTTSNVTTSEPTASPSTGPVAATNPVAIPSASPSAQPVTSPDDGNVPNATPSSSATLASTDKPVSEGSIRSNGNQTKYVTLIIFLISYVFSFKYT